MKKFLQCIFLVAMFWLPQSHINGQATDDLARVAMDYVRSDDPVRSFATALANIPLEEREMHVAGFVSSYSLTPVIGSDTIAGLYWYGNAEKVLITGDLQKGWSQPDALEKIPGGEKAFFYISYRLPRDARLDYQLIVDSVYMTDPRNEKITPSGYGPHSEIAMPGFRPDAARARYQEVPRGSTDTMYFRSSNYDIASRMITVYLPPGYQDLKNLPVLYVMDGIEAFEWMNYQNVLDNLIAWDRIRPVIAVFIPPGNREEEFIGKKFKVYQDALCHEIVPLIDSKYPTDVRPESRGITGISAGGYFALMTVLERSDIIARGAGQSPSLFPTAFQALKKNQKALKKNKEIRIYFDMGRYDLPGGFLGGKSFHELGESFHNEMNSLDIPHQYLAVNDGHEWANWRERMPGILAFFFSK